MRIFHKNKQTEKMVFFVPKIKWPKYVMSRHNISSKLYLIHFKMTLYIAVEKLIKKPSFVLQDIYQHNQTNSRSY